jgi:hypothetical protein
MRRQVVAFAVMFHGYSMGMRCQLVELSCSLMGIVHRFLP